MKDLLNSLYEHKTLSKEEAKKVLTDIGNGMFDPMQIASFLTVFNVRSITINELQGFREAMIALSKRVDLSDFDPIDIVGTGGDGKDTFNISTTAALVVAGAGINVAKHGNYGVSSGCGSSNVLEYLGVPFHDNEEGLRQQLETAGFCMMHAPLFHPAMKHVAPIRKALKVRTFFNILGPLINPASPKKHLLGVFNLETLRLYGYLFQRTDHRYSIIHALDGYDEISLTGSAKIIDNEGEKMVKPADFGFPTAAPEQLAGGESIEASAKILVSILKNEASDVLKNTVLANATLAIQCAKPGTSQADALGMAQASLTSGKAYDVLQKSIKK